MQGQGNKASSATDYALTDANIGTKAYGTVYYRLRQVDARMALPPYSPVRTVRFTAGAKGRNQPLPQSGNDGNHGYPRPDSPAGRHLSGQLLLDLAGRAVSAYFELAGGLRS